jgi:hypothetical protein
MAMSAAWEYQTASNAGRKVATKAALILGLFQRNSTVRIWRALSTEETSQVNVLK